MTQILENGEEMKTWQVLALCLLGIVALGAYIYFLHSLNLKEIPGTCLNDWTLPGCGNKRWD